ncbi:hypothetical protein OROHE_021246 [Orobanche hederae]
MSNSANPNSFGAPSSEKISEKSHLQENENRSCPQTKTATEIFPGNTISANIDRPLSPDLDGKSSNLGKNVAAQPPNQPFQAVDLGRFLFPMSPVSTATVNNVSNISAHNSEFPRDAGVISVGSIPLLKDPALTAGVFNPEIDGSNKNSQRSTSAFATLPVSGDIPVVAESTVAQTTLVDGSTPGSQNLEGHSRTAGVSTDQASKPVTDGEKDPVSHKNGSQNSLARNTQLSQLADAVKGVKNVSASGVGQSPENPVSVEGKDLDSPLGQA